jgi:O-antigen/teichoic acid export membrane protein
MIAESAVAPEVGEVTETAETADSRRGLARSIGVLAGSQVVTWVLTLAYTIVVPRILGPVGVGELTTAVSATSILLTVVELGLTVLLVRKIAQDRTRAGELISTTLLIQAVLYAPAVAIMAIFVGLQHFDVEQQVVLWLATAALLPQILKLPFQSAFQATDNMGFYAATGVITKVLSSFGGIALVLLGFGVVSIASLGLAIEAFTLVLNVKWALPRFKLTSHLRAGQAAALAVESLPLFANYVVHTTYLWINVLLLATFTSAAVVGWYGVSSRLVGTLYFLPVIVSTAMLPRFSASFDGRFGALQTRARPTVELILAFSLPIAVGAALVSGELIELIYGPPFVASAIVLSILLASVPFTYFNILIWQVLVASSRQITWTKVMVGALAINVVLNLLLINFFQSRTGNGAIGAATSLVVTEGLMSLAGVVILPQLLNQASFLRLARAVLATALMAAAVVAVRKVGLPAQILAGLFAFSALAILLRVIAVGEIRELYSAIARKRGVARAQA